MLNKIFAFIFELAQPKNTATWLKYDDPSTFLEEPFTNGNPLAKLMHFPLKHAINKRKKEQADKR